MDSGIRDCNASEMSCGALDLNSILYLSGIKLYRIALLRASDVVSEQEGARKAVCELAFLDHRRHIHATSGDALFNTNAEGLLRRISSTVKCHISLGKKNSHAESHVVGFLKLQRCTETVEFSAA
jgi:hypothetical protein